MPRGSNTSTRRPCCRKRVARKCRASCSVAPLTERHSPSCSHRTYARSPPGTAPRLADPRVDTSQLRLSRIDIGKTTSVHVLVELVVDPSRRRGQQHRHVAAALHLAQRDTQQVIELP